MKLNTLSILDTKLSMFVLMVRVVDVTMSWSTVSRRVFVWSLSAPFNVVTVVVRDVDTLVGGGGGRGKDKYNNYSPRKSV